jgi:hypothetical protein
MSYRVYAFTSTGVVVADGAVAAANLVSSATSGEAVVFIVKTADGVVPAIEIVKNVNDLTQVTANAVAGNLNANVKEAFASLLGALAAAASIGRGPAAALAADQFMSEAFKGAYDAASGWSANQDWTPFFDFIDGMGTSGGVPVSPIAFDPDLYRVPGLPSVIDPICNARVTNALNWVPPRRDPLVLDLDGSGITTSAINPAAPILFDHDGDGTKTASGWIASGEAIVVRDLNGNNLIDSGRELFGDNTILTRGLRAGQVAANGFEALADLDMDINGVADGKFDAADTAYASVKLWRDLDQDGVSQSSELFTFAQLGVASITTTGTADNVNLGGDNTQTHAGTFTRTTGATGQAGTAHLAASLLLANNNFYREFSDDPVLSAEAQALPQMQGSGTVRDLRPAMSLGTPQAAALQTLLTQFAADTTRDAQLGSLDALIQSWGATSAMPTSAQTNRVIANYGGPNVIDTYGATAIERYALDNPALYAKITALEQFNGQTILDKWVRTTTAWYYNEQDQGWRQYTYGEVMFSEPQADFINQAYDALKGSESKALPQSSAQTPCNLRHRQYGLRCARSGSSRRVLRHQCKYNAARSQKTSPLATSPRLRAWCEWQDQDVFLEQRVYPRLRLQQIAL